MQTQSIRQVVGDKAKGCISKTEVTRKESTPNFLKNEHFYSPTRTLMCVIRGQEIFVFQKIWCALFSCYLHRHTPTDEVAHISKSFLAKQQQYQEIIRRIPCKNAPKNLEKLFECNTGIINSILNKKHHNNQNYESIFTYTWSFFFRCEWLRLCSICKTLLETS